MVSQSGHILTAAATTTASFVFIPIDQATLPALPTSTGKPISSCTLRHHATAPCPAQHLLDVIFLVINHASLSKRLFSTLRPSTLVIVIDHHLWAINGCAFYVQS
jgi:hypothetical protein